MSDIHSKLASVMEMTGPLGKTEQNREQGFNFRSIEAITGAARSLLAAQGISIAPRVLQVESSEVTSGRGSKGFRTVVWMEYTFATGSDDSFIVVSMAGEAVDYGDKSTSKACQMAFKYALTQVLLIGSGEDPDTHSPDVGSSRSGSSRQSGRGRGRQEATTTPTNGADGREKPSQAFLRGWVSEAKGRLFVATGSDNEKTKELWAALLESFSMNPHDIPTVDVKPKVEEALVLMIADLQSAEK